MRKFTIYDLRFTIERALLCGILMLFCSGLHGQERALKIEVDSSKRIAGEVATIKVSATVPADHHLTWALPGIASRGIELVDSPKTDSNSRGGEMIYHRSYRVSVYDSGLFYFPSVQVSVWDKGLLKQVLHTDSVTLHYQLMKVDTARDAKPIKEPVIIPSALDKYWPYILGLIALLLIVAAVFYFRRGKPSLFEPKPEKLPPPYDEAKESLDNLQKSKAWDTGDSKQFYIRLSNIMRRYISRTIHIDAMEMTTSEIVRELKKEGIEPMERIRIKEVLELADLVKFAKHKPGPEENKASLDSSVQYLDNTHSSDKGTGITE